MSKIISVSKKLSCGYHTLMFIYESMYEFSASNLNVKSKKIEKKIE
ncbi:MAG: hypothetical protein Satyrvirus24_16 [Satyrvirus sp.]|uniref:Uncharacterized protein n=1 Tax=Satyrvirus sp. TaxID=2487771 RepID=A0A3G5AEH8_9VIRU|nr:MAG: hypothetical protein Satyrvirus24_16 [Satyrvirus sp.]